MSDRPEAPKPAGPLASPEPWNLVAEGYEEIDPPLPRSVFPLGPGDAALRFDETPSDRRRLRSRHDDAAARAGGPAVSPASTSRQACSRNFAATSPRPERPISTSSKPTARHCRFRTTASTLAVSMFGLMFFPDREQGICRAAPRARAGRSGAGVELGAGRPSPLMQMVFGGTSARRRPAPEPPPVRPGGPRGLRARDA